MRTISLNETIPVISCSSHLPAGTAVMAALYAHARAHTHRAGGPGSPGAPGPTGATLPSLPPFLSLQRRPSYMHNRFPIYFLSKALGKHFPPPPFLFLLLAFPLSVKSLLVGLQLPLWHLPLLISPCYCRCCPWGLNEEQVNIIRSLSGKRMGRKPNTDQGIHYIGYLI